MARVTKDLVSRPFLLKHLNEQVRYCETVIAQYEKVFDNSHDIFEVKAADTMANAYRMQKKAFLDAIEIANNLPTIRS